MGEIRFVRDPNTIFYLILLHLICLSIYFLCFMCQIKLFIFYVLYVSDKVFDPTCSTQKVYEEGAKDVALSALNGINCNRHSHVSPYISILLASALFG